MEKFLLRYKLEVLRNVFIFTGNKLVCGPCVVSKS